MHAFHSPFFTRDTIYAIARICYANSVCPSVTRVICVKTAERIIEIFLPSDDRPIILVFRHQGCLRKSGGFTPTGLPNTRGVAIFDQYAAISRKRDRGIVTMEDEYKVVCALSNGAIFNDLE